MSRTRDVVACIACAVVLATIVVLADTGAMPGLFSWLGTIPGADKPIHAILMGTLAYLVNRALACRRTRFAGLTVLTGSAIVALVVTSEELSQLWLPRRSFSWLDLLADYVGIFLAGPLAKRGAFADDVAAACHNAAGARCARQARSSPARHLRGPEARHP